MKKTLILSTLSLSASLLHAEEQPNIILFLVDDMGWQDTSVPFGDSISEFNKIYHTPNMERLAEKGVKFTNAYSCSVSTPTRVSLLTGMNAARHKVTNWTLHKNRPTDSKHSILDYPKWNVNGLSPIEGVENSVHARPLPQILKDGGYHTIHCGKAHFGAMGTPGEDPIALGFDVNIAGSALGGPGSYYGEQSYGANMNGRRTLWAIEGLEKYHDTDTFLSEALTLEAISALDKRDESKPFFLYMAHYALHIPIMPDRRFYQKYLDKGMDKREAAYATLVEGMDKSLGDLMNYLEDNDLSDNTIIIFMSDNGGFSAHGARGGALHTHNLPLNSGKGSAHEGGIREPMLLYWSGVTEPNSQCDDYLIIEDYFPTILEMAQVETPADVQIIDGRSFIPLLTGKGRNPSKGRSLYWNYPHNWGPTGPGIGATCSVRSGDWKLIYYYDTGRKQLFNLKRDLGETNDLSESNPKKVKKLSKNLGEYLRSVDAQRPIFKATGRDTPWSDEV